MNFKITVQQLSYDVENDIHQKEVYIIKSDMTSGSIKQDDKGKWKFIGKTVPPAKALKESPEVYGVEIEKYIAEKNLKAAFVSSMIGQETSDSKKPFEVELEHLGDCYKVTFVKVGDNLQVASYSKKAK